MYIYYVISVNTLLTYCFCFAFSGPKVSSNSTSEKPLIELSGVLSSYDILAKNSDFTCAVPINSAANAFNSS